MRLLSSGYGEAAARWGAACFAVAALGDVWIGRMTFALGVSLALAAGLALMRERWLCAAVLAALCAAASPVAGVLLALAGLTVSLERRSPRELLTLAAPVAIVVLALAALFPEGGYEPYPILSFAATIVVVAAFLLALPPRARLLRLGAYVYLAACVACLLVHSPMGSNVERYGVLLAGPLLLCALLAQPQERDGVSVWRRIGPVGAAAICVIALWVVWGPVRETAAVAGSEATSAAYYVPVEHFLAEQAGGPVRVEVPLTRSHWEAALLAPTVSLARGWEKQLEMRDDDVLLADGLTAASYERWLHEQAVSYVALPDVALDPSSAQEGRLIQPRPAVPARGVRERALAHLPRARCDAAALGTRSADVAGARLVRAARADAGPVRGAGALHALLDDHARRWLRGAGAGRLDGAQRACAGHDGGDGELLAVACVQLRWLMLFGRKRSLTR